MDVDQQHHFMGLALQQAEEALQKQEVPVGAVIVHDGIVIGRGHNLTASMRDATAHAEMVALSAAYNYFGDWRLEECWLFCTLEPCPMCAGAAMLSRIGTIVYGAKDPKFGACGSIVDIPAEARFNHQMNVISGVREEEVAVMMREFFVQLRKNKERPN
jgi:tRNA(adenine34) deaminase